MCSRHRLLFLADGKCFDADIKYSTFRCGHKQYGKYTTAHQNLIYIEIESNNSRGIRNKGDEMRQ